MDPAVDTEMPDGREFRSASGVDVTLIDEMLAMTVEERLAHLESAARSLEQLLADIGRT